MPTQCQFGTQQVEADRFVAAIGPDRKLQGSIAVRRIDGTPDLSRAGYQPPKPDKKPHRGKRAFDQKAAEGARKPKFDRHEPADQRPAFEAKSWAGKPGKVKFDKASSAKHKKSKKRPG